MTLPYEGTSAGMSALSNVEALLRRFGCSNYGVMTDWEKGQIIVQFTWKSRQVSVAASYTGYTEAWKKHHPYNSNYKTRDRWSAKAQNKGEMAVPSILRDWIKGQVTAIETGVVDFETAFMPHMLASDGRRLIEHAREVMPALEDHSND